MPHPLAHLLPDLLMDIREHLSGLESVGTRCVLPAATLYKGRRVLGETCALYLATEIADGGCTTIDLHRDTCGGSCPVDISGATRIAVSIP